MRPSGSEGPGAPAGAPPAPAGGIVRFGPVVISYGAGVLVPRPWTLAQSEWVAQCAPALPDGPVLELCAGAGQIGLATAVLTGRHLVQVDADPAAVAWARGNAERAGVAGRTDVRLAGLDDALADGERFPIILADPPYIPSAEVSRFPADPRVAIDGGGDGLSLARRCVALADRHLCDGGLVSLQLWSAAQADRLLHEVAARHPRLGDAARRAPGENGVLVHLRTPAG